MSRKARNILCVAAVALALTAAGLVLGWHYVNAPYGGTEPVWVYIPAGSGRAAVADSVKAATDAGFAGKVISVLYGIDADAAPHGAFKIAPGDRVRAVARRLQHNRQTPVRVTFNNVRTLDALAASIADQLELDANDFLTAADSILPAAGFKKREEYPAAFIPDTYEFYWTSTPGATVGRLLDYRNRFWDDNRRARAAELGLNPVKVATLASIVEEESNAADERPTIARLYLNRLRIGMPLQADPTVKFAVGDFTLRRIRAAHLAVNSPYNTYRHRGLPPGPIRIADQRALDAVLSAPVHNYLYMCAKEDFSGRHNFATDLATHNRNAARYRAALNRRNIQ